MKIICISILIIILWWLLGGLLSVQIVNLAPEKYIFSDQFIINNSIDVYMMIVMIPFLVSNSISALVVAILAQLILKPALNCRIGLLLMLLGSTPFVILTSYKDKLSFLIAKIFVMGISVFVFGYLGALIGNIANQRFGRQRWKAKE